MSIKRWVILLPVVVFLFAAMQLSAECGENGTYPSLHHKAHSFYKVDNKSSHNIGVEFPHLFPTSPYFESIPRRDNRPCRPLFSPVIGPTVIKLKADFSDNFNALHYFSSIRIGYGRVFDQLMRLNI